MSGERDLRTLLSNLQPSLVPGVYVFCSVAHPVTAIPDVQPLATVHEPEGLTMILLVDDAERFGLSFHGRFRCIRLEVHSSLQAVGLTAKVATLLAEHDISANMLAGAYHDHVLVPEERAQNALELLQHVR